MSRRGSRTRPLCGILLGAVLGCSPEEPAAKSPIAATADAPRLVDVARQLGIDARHRRGADRRMHLHETKGGGAAWLDYDRDGDPDLYLTSGQGRGADGSVPRRGRNRLLRNDGDRFVDVTDIAGVAGSGYGLGVASGDIDNDGYPDLLVTNFGDNDLYRNRGDGSFEPLDGPPVRPPDPFSAGAAFADLDGDGLVDLYVASYIACDASKPPVCFEETPDGGRTRVYCGPITYVGARDRVYRNRGDGRFEDVTGPSGIGSGSDARSKSLGVLAGDLDADGDVDIFVACDTTANLLYRNRGDGTFDEIGLESGVSSSDTGVYEGSMGVAIACLTDSGRPDILVTNFAEETNRLHRMMPDGDFLDVTASTAIGRGSRPLVGWGAVFFDAGCDGSTDLFVANGHIYPNAAEFLPERTYEQRNLLYARSGSRFEDVSGRAGPALSTTRAFRGVAMADYDLDGDVDLLVTALDEEPLLLRSEGPRGHHLSVELVGDGPGGRDAVGARVTIESASGRQTRWRTSGGSYLCGSEPRLHFGLGDDERVDRLVVDWPGGGTTVLEGLDVDRGITVERRR